LNRMIDEINQRWRGIAVQRAAEAMEADGKDRTKDAPDSRGVPEGKPKTREELLEDLQKRLEAR